MIEYTIDERQYLVNGWLSGTHTCEDLANHFARVLKDPRYKPTFDSLFRVDANLEGPILSELPEVASLLEMLAQRKEHTKWAIVMPAGFKRTVIEFLLRDVNLRAVTMRFFDSEDAAVAWLNVGRSVPLTLADNRTVHST